MKKQIITAIAIVFVVMYLFIGFIYLELDFRCWSKDIRSAYLFFSITFSFISSWVIAYLNQDL